MTQRVARPMKFAAFISIIISVAVMLAACQGAVGKPGDPGVTGPQGPKGEPGDLGTTGPAGHNAFIDLGKDNLVEVNIDSTNKNRAIAPRAIDVSLLFAGGTPPITYKRIAPETTEIDKNNLDPAATESQTVYTSDISVGDPIPNGMLTVMVRESKKLKDLTEPAGDNFNSVVFKVEGTDANGVAHEGLVKVRANRAPTAGDKPIPDLIVGTLGETTVDKTKDRDADGFYPYKVGNMVSFSKILRTTLNCDMFNMCEKSLVSESYYKDDGFAVGLDGLDNLTFTATIDDSEKAEYIEVMPFTATGRNGLTIKGLKSTWNPTKGGKEKKGADEPVTVTITAQDLNGLMDDTRTFEVSVNGAPVRTDEPLPTETIAPTKIAKIDLSLFFKDPEGDKLSFSAESSSKSRAVVSMLNNDLTITGKGSGSATITITATEDGTTGLEQWVKAQFEVTVSS